MDEKTLYIVDGTAYIFRAFYGNPNLSTSQGVPTSALFGFTHMLRRLVGEQMPDYLAVAFDAGKATFRTEMYAEYKANRDTPPDALLDQIPRVIELTRAFNIPILIQPGVEADDLIASLVKEAKAREIPVVIVSSDKDLMQLIGPGVTMLDTMRDKSFGEAEVLERFQVPAEKVVEVLALAGDSSDNVPGVPGIGEKTAGKLIAEYGSLEALYDNLERVSGKKRQESLREFKAQAFLSRELVRLRDDCAVAFDLEALRLSDPDYAALARLFREFEFHRLLQDIQGRLTEEEAAPAAALERPAKRYAAIWTEEALAAAVAACAAAEAFALDLETTSLNALEAEIVGVALSWEPHAGVYVPVGHRALGTPRQLPLALVLGSLRGLLEPAETRWVAHNGKYDMQVMARYGLTPGRLFFDTMLASYLVDPGRQSHSLDALARSLLGQPTITYEEVAGKGAKQLGFDMVDVERATAYAAEDADVTLLLYQALAPALAEVGGERLMTALELPLVPVLAQMERDGVLIDAGALAQMSVDFEAELHALEQQAHALVGEAFNLNSPIQLRKILFEDLKLPAKKQTKSGASTDQSVLEELVGEHPLPALILEHRSFAKLKSTYVDALPALRDGAGRVHTSFNQAVAATGRLSSSHPNLQNIPVRTARGREIRRAFVAPPGMALLSADYSQIELRLLAHLSEDKALCGAFVHGEDIHRKTAAEMFGVPLVMVTPQQRAAGKTINFGVIYGIGAARLAQSLGLTRQEGRKYIDAYFAQYPGVSAYFERLVQEARTRGYAETMMGRRRPIGELLSPREAIRALGERLAINTPIQGSAADLIKLAMIRIQARLQREGLGAKMLLQVHDELVFEAPQEALPSLRALVSQEMSQVVPLRVPLVVDTATGPTWLDAK
jgi:DNA polymerase-1